jgi:hypothetical protein
MNEKVAVNKHLTGRKVQRAVLYWVYSFDYSGNVTKKIRSRSSYIWNGIIASPYFLGQNLELLIGDVAQMAIDPIKLKLEASAIDQSREFRNVRQAVLEKLRDFPLTLQILLISKWHVGIIILSTELNMPLYIDEYILIGRALGHRLRRSGKAFFKSDGMYVSEALIEKTKLLEARAKIKIATRPEDILKTVYFFGELVGQNLTGAEKLGILTHRIDFETAPESDIQRVESQESIYIERPEKFYLTQYGGAIISERKLGGIHYPRHTFLHTFIVQ